MKVSREELLHIANLASLNLKEEDIVVDCTLGYGGHSSNILKRIKKGFLFAFDQNMNDP